MAGHKTFVNQTGDRLAVTLYIRSGSDPATQAGTQDFSLGPNASEDVSYGSDSDIYLNGLSVASILNGQVSGAQDFVATRGSALDDLFNRNSIIQINFANEGFQLSSRNG